MSDIVRVLSSFEVRPEYRKNKNDRTVVRCWVLSPSLGLGEQWREEYRSEALAKAAADEHAGAPVHWSVASRTPQGQKTFRGYLI